MRKQYKFGGFVPPDAPVTGAKKKPVREAPAPQEDETEPVQPEVQQKGGKE